MEKKEDFRTTTNVWNENIETVLTSIGKDCSRYKWSNLKEAEQALKKYNILMYCLIVLGPISGILSSVNSEDDIRLVLNVLITIFSFVTGILSAILKFSKYQEKIALYHSLVAKYTSLEGNIQRQLSLNREDRVNAGEYLEWVSTSFDELFSSAPLLGDSTKEEPIPVDTSKSNPTLEVKVGIQPVLSDLNKFSDGRMRYELARLGRQVR